MSSFRTYGVCGFFLALLCAGHGPAAPPRANAGTESKDRPAPRVDTYGDPLPPGAVARLGTTRLRFRGLRSLFGFSADRKTLLTLGGDGVFRLLDPATGRPVRRVPLPPKVVEALRSQVGSTGSDSVLLTLSGDARTAALIDGHAGAVVLDLTTGKEKLRIPKEANGPQGFVPRVLGYPLSRDGKLFAAGGPGPKGETQVVWFDTATGKVVHRIDLGNNVALGELAFLPDGRALAFTEFRPEGKVRLRMGDTRSGKEVGSVGLTDGNLRQLAFLPAGKAFLTLGNPEAPVRLLEAVTGKEIRTFGDKDGPLSRFALSEDGKILVATSPGKVSVWEVATGKRLHGFRHPGFGKDIPPDVALSPDGKTLAVAGQYRLVLWDVTTGKELHATGGHVAPVVSVAFAPDGRRLVSAAEDRTVRVWELPSGKEDRRFSPVARPAEVAAEAGAFARFTQDGKTVVAAWPGIPAQVWNSRTARALRRLGEKNGAYPVAVSADGNLLAAGSADGCVRVYEVATGKEARALVWHRPQAAGPEKFDGQLAAVAFSPDGRTLAATGLIMMANYNVKVLVWLGEMSTGRKRLQITLYAGNIKVEMNRAANALLIGGQAESGFSLTYSADGSGWLWVWTM